MANINNNTIPKYIKYLMVTFNFIASLSSIIGLIYTIFYQSIKSLSAWIWIIGIVFFICGFIASILYLRAEKYNSFKLCLHYASGLHKILHCLRDMNKSLDNLRLRSTKMEKSDFLRMITSDCIDIMNKLSSILSDYTQCKVRACIKLNDFIKENETDPEEIYLITFARNGWSGVNSAIKEQAKKVKITENTDFEYIYGIKEVYDENKIHYFYQRDLKKYDQILRKESNGEKMYKNSDHNWRKKYNTTIVMPMRYLKTSNEKEAIYDIVGFLCVDAKKEGSFENSNINLTIEFLKGVSDILYSYLNSCVTYYKSINQKEE